jgi:hypothetical protein
MSCDRRAPLDLYSTQCGRHVCASLQTSNIIIWAFCVRAACSMCIRDKSTQNPSTQRRSVLKRAGQNLNKPAATQGNDSVSFRRASTFCGCGFDLLFFVAATHVDALSPQNHVACCINITLQFSFKADFS